MDNIWSMASGSVRGKIIFWLDTKGWMSYYRFTPTPLGGGKESEMKQEQTLKRLKTIEGHLRGVTRMVEDDAYCIDVIRQIQAVQAALNKVSTGILEDHLNSCVTTAIQGDDPKERERVLKEITDVFETATKV
jgi:CsoR family transcriptional regulator, copper-sensing transcriptional repressor